jgi:hypothetical protein
MKTSKVIQDITVYRSNAKDSEHKLLWAKVNFPPRGLKGGNKKPIKAGRIFKSKIVK